MTKFMKLLRDRSGSVAVDFAFAFPVLLTLMLGTIQLGVYLQASGTLRHALGEGIRYAKVYPDATSTEVLDEVRSEMPAMNTSNISRLQFIRGTSNGAEYGRISIAYKLEPLIPLMPVPAITITETKTAYIPS